MSDASDMAFEQSELGRRLDQVVTLGKITQIDLAKSLARVALDEDSDDGGIVTDFLPWLEVRHGSIRGRFAPSVGERVVVVAPAGELGAGFILGGLPCTDSPAPWSDTKAGFDFGGDASWTHDPLTNASVLALPSDGTLTLKVGGTSIKITNGVVEIDAASIKLGSRGVLREIARKGDTVVGGVITGGSSAVKAV
jgi:phage baseplate assembly protein V